MATKRTVTYKCPYCTRRFTREDLVLHVQDEHEDMIPEGFTPFRLVFNYVNKKPLSYHGKCTECGGPTPWDENKGRYDRQCEKKACKESYVKKFEENMMRTRGVTRISATEEGQKQMLANRKISGTYVMSDGGKKTYTGSYELKALEFMDKVIHIKSSDILCPGPILEYSFEGKTHIYITDFYYQPYNLIIEVKDGGDNPNKRNMPEYRAKQIAKEQFIIKHTNYNYLRLTNNDFSQLLAVFANLKMQMVENTGERVIHVNENKFLTEMMNALNSGKVVGLKDSDAYIVNYMQNNVFSDDTYNNAYKVGISNSVRLDNIFGPDENGKFNKIDESTIKIADFYKIPISVGEASSKLHSYIGSDVSNTFVYETLFNKKMYTHDQIMIESGVEKVKSFAELLSEAQKEFVSFLEYSNLDFSEEENAISELENKIKLMRKEQKRNG